MKLIALLISMRKLIAVILSGVAIALFSGCASSRTVYWYPRTEPQYYDWLAEKGSSHKIYLGDTPPALTDFHSRYNTYRHELTDAEIQSGRFDYPTFVVGKAGYYEKEITPEPLMLDAKTMSAIRKGMLWSTAVTIQLERNPNYAGPDKKNFIKLTINSEPQGARIYENGKLLGTAPVFLNYEIQNNHYETGVFRCAPLVAVHDACLPERQDVELRVNSDWRYESSKTHEYATVFLLKRDPNYKPPVIVQNQGTSPDTVNVNVSQQKDELDLLQQITQIGVMIKSLQPIR